jgi:hypothetical protein
LRILSLEVHPIFFIKIHEKNRTLNIGGPK